MKKQLKQIYLKYKKELMPLTLTVAAIILFFSIVIPQVNEIKGKLQDVKTQQKTNEDLRASESVLNSVSDSNIEDDYEIAVAALPLQKSIGSIFQALTAAASESNVSIGSLNVQVGNVYDVDSEKTIGKTVEGVPFLNLIISVTGTNAFDFTNFANELYKTTPVVEINEISTTDTEAKYDLNFYFKPINEKGFKAQSVITPLTPPQRELLTTLEAWSQ